MAIISQFIGATRASLGASFLDTRAIVHVHESYDTGATVETVYVGGFEVDSYGGGDVFSERISLSASNKLQKLSHNTVPVPLSIRSIKRYYDGFGDEDTSKTNFTISDAGVAISDGVASFTFTGVSESKVLRLNAEEPISDFRLKFSLKKNTAALSDAQQVEVDFRVLDEENLYRFIFAPGSSLYYLLKYEDGVASVVGSAYGASIGNNTYLYGMLVARGGYMYFASSSDDITYQVKVEGSDQTYNDGALSIGARAQNNAIWSLGVFNLIEIGDRLTTEDVIKRSLALSSVDSVSFQGHLDGFNSFVTSSGTSVVTGITNGFHQADLYNTSSGSSWHTYFTSGSTFSDFVFECQVKGVSGNYVGMAMGATNEFYANTFYLGTTPNHLIEVYDNGTRYPRINHSNYVHMRGDIWYDLKMVKIEDSLEWFVNKTLMGALIGTGIEVLTSERLGFAVWRGSATGTRTSFRNPRVTRLNQSVETLSIDPNTNLKSIYDRYLPDGSIGIVSGTTVNIFEIGSSRGVLTVNSNLMSVETDISNNEGYNTIMASSDRAATVSLNSNQRKWFQRDSYNAMYINDVNISSTTEATSIGNRAFADGNRSIEQVVLQTSHFPTMETYDTINLVDEANGISHGYHVLSSSRSFLPESGFRQTLIISKT